MPNPVVHRARSIVPCILMVAMIAVPALSAVSETSAADAESTYRVSTFQADVTCPVGHPLLGGLRQPAKKIVDRLWARGLVLSGGKKPVVLCAVDWCEIRNDSYDHWRDALAKAARTTCERVLVCSLHQHDAPVTDARAARLLADAGLPGAMFDVAFERKCIDRTASALREGLDRATPVTHVGIGRATVEKIASNRRVAREDGTVTYGRGSSSGGNALFRQAPEGEIDPWLRTLSFWNGDKPLVALHCYATHPMSYYGRGGVSADFVGMARELMQRENPKVFQIYASGCSGDVTAGKYNDGSPANRPLLAKRLFTAMRTAWKKTKRIPLKNAGFRTTQLQLPFRPDATHSAKSLKAVLNNEKATHNQRILSAMGLASRQRNAAGRRIDFPCLDLGSAQIVLFPGEAFVHYQLRAQRQRPKSLVISIGYGECWPGYIPAAQGFKDRFRDVWLWVGPGSERRIARALEQVLPKHR